MMKNKTLIAILALAASLSLATTASADTTWDQIEQQGNARITQLWSEYQQALQDRQNAWNQTQGDRYSNAYMNADVHAGAALQEYERARTQLGDDLHNYDVSQYQKQSTATPSASDQPQQEQSSEATSQSAQPVATTQESQASQNTQTVTIAQKPQASQTASAAAKTDKLSSQDQKSAQTATESQKTTTQATEATGQTGHLPQTGNAVGWLAPLLGMLGIGIAVKEAKREGLGS